MSEPTSARERWNARRAACDFEPFPDEPAAWLVEHAQLLGGRGRALDVACGDGRNALYLARQGYDVDAVDVSDVAIDRLRAAAQDRGLTICPRTADLEVESLAVDAYDVVVNFNYLQRDLFGALAGALRAGGLLFFETFGRAHVDELGRDLNPAYVLAHNELLQAFPALRVRDYFEGVAERAGGRRGVASLVAQRPAE